MFSKLTIGSQRLKKLTNYITIISRGNLSSCWRQKTRQFDRKPKKSRLILWWRKWKNYLTSLNYDNDFTSSSWRSSQTGNFERQTWLLLQRRQDQPMEYVGETSKNFDFYLEIFWIFIFYFWLSTFNFVKTK